MTFIEPFDDADMTYNSSAKRYILTSDFVSNRGINLSLILNTEMAPNPVGLEELFLDRISSLVYNHIYRYGRSKKEKQYLLACSPAFRDVIRDAMLERIMYIIDSGDLSTKAGVIIEKGNRVDVRDLVPSPEEVEILRSAGLLHRGKYIFIKDTTLNW